MTYIRTATGSLPTHCAPIDKNAIREIKTRSAIPFSSFEMPELCPISIQEIRERHTRQRQRENKRPFKSNFRDLTGLRRGSVTVIGLIQYIENGKSRWCVRCDCGRHEPRHHYKWFKGYRNEVPDYCSYCSPLSLEEQVMQMDGFNSKLMESA
jgi:hypothetical protein